jgi:GDP-L-fucose synthase
MQHYSDERIINVGSGRDISIGELAAKIAGIVGFHGRIVHDTSKPDGTMLRCSDVSRLFEMGWRPTVPLREGIRLTYEWYRDHENSILHRGGA